MCLEPVYSPKIQQLNIRLPENSADVFRNLQKNVTLRDLYSMCIKCQYSRRQFIWT